MITDPIADMLTRIRNGQMARHTQVRVPSSKIKQRIADILVSEGYVQSAAVEGEGTKQEIAIELKYANNRPIIRKLERASRPGRRQYVKWDEIPRVRDGLGLAIVSTSRGVMSGREARRERVGGELLCTIY